MSSKQMRVSQEQFDTIKELAKKTGKNRTELLSNAVGLISKIIKYKAISIKLTCEDGTEKELFLSVLDN